MITGQHVLVWKTIPTELGDSISFRVGRTDISTKRHVVLFQWKSSPINQLFRSYPLKYAYEDLSDDQFEELVVFICQKLLGMGVQPFAKGADAGKDARFHGTAAEIPNPNVPWVGKVIIQAKHTNGINRSCSETDFFGSDDTSKSTILGKEIQRIADLREDGELDYYMIFTNRRLTSGTEKEIRKYISQNCDVPEDSILIFGIEHIEILLKTYPEIVERAQINPVDSPLIVSPDDLSEIIEALANSEFIDSNAFDPPVPRVGYATKNTLNNMDPDYAKEIRKRYLKETATIQAFLAAPENRDLLEKYESVVEEFQLKILAKRKPEQTFDAVLEYLIDLLFARDPVLRKRGNKRLTRAMLFYMYWICDLGKVE